jgi:plasmid stabilization system protein ParE
VSFAVQLTKEAEADLLRLYGFILDRELNRPDGGNLDMAEKALNAIQNGFATLSASPFTCRKADQSSFQRVLIIPFSHAGYVALFEIVDNTLVVITAVRHHREDDYH